MANQRWWSDTSLWRNNNNAVSRSSLPCGRHLWPCWLFQVLQPPTRSSTQQQQFESLYPLTVWHPIKPRLLLIPLLTPWQITVITCDEVCQHFYGIVRYDTIPCYIVYNTIRYAVSFGFSLFLAALVKFSSLLPTIEFALYVLFALFVLFAAPRI